MAWSHLLLKESTNLFCTFLFCSGGKKICRRSYSLTDDVGKTLIPIERSLLKLKIIDKEPLVRRSPSPTALSKARKRLLNERAMRLHRRLAARPKGAESLEGKKRKI